MTSLPVVDLGCHSHHAHQGASQDSIARLIARFRPASLYGFDPHPDLAEGKTRERRCTVTRTRAAAWVYDGEIAYRQNRLSSHVSAPLATGEIILTAQDVVVPCFDLARWLAGRRVILKLDVEGAEYRLLSHLVAKGRDLNCERILVEWHGPPSGPDDWQARRDDLLRALRCPVEEWEPVRA